VRHHAIRGALLLALALAAGDGGGSPTSVPAPKPTLPVVIPYPVVPPAPTQTSQCRRGEATLVDLLQPLSGVLEPPRSLDLAEL
jgi:hypothetical protein